MPMSKYVGVDTNILIYLQDKDSPYFKKASLFMDKVYDRTFCPVISSQNIIEFVSVMSNPKVMGRKIPMKDILDAIVEVKDSGYFKIIFPDTSVLNSYLKMSAKLNLSGAENHDLFLASTFISNKLDTVITEDEKVFKRCRMKTISLNKLDS